MKRYLLDTNVLLHDPKALTSFEENDVLVPIYVIEEIDRFKRQLSRLGEHARRISRFLDDLRQRGRLSRSPRPGPHHGTGAFISLRKAPTPPGPPLRFLRRATDGPQQAELSAGGAG